MTQLMLKDSHKTNIHRYRTLIKEYEIDLKDPNISDDVKKQLREDLDSVKNVLDEYLNNYDEFHNRVNNMINDELVRLEGETANISSNSEEKKEPSGDTSPIKESAGSEYYRAPKTRQETEIFMRESAGGQIREYGHILYRKMEDLLESGYLIHVANSNNESYITESKKAYEKMLKEINAVTQSERNEFYDIFGKSKECSLAKDKDGYYVRTHRCRSKSYKNIKDIPKKDVDFVRSTS